MADLINEFSWSVSRDQLFQTCERAYYYQYYGSWNGWNRDAPPRTRLLYRLKNIRTLEMWGGTIVHELIAEALQRFARAQVPIRAGELQARARQRLRDGWRESVSRAWERYPKKTNLYGLYYGNGKTLPRERTDRVRDRVNACLQAFAESDLLREIQAVPFVDWKPIDQLDTFTVDGLKVWCAIDFAYHDPAGSLRIIDWKTGAEKSEALQTQLACYTLYAQEKWFTPPERIRTAGVFLREDARCAEYPVTPENLIAARDYMLTSAAGMRNRLRDVEANTAGEADFPLTNHENACHSCNFRQACPRFADVDP